MPKGRIEVKIQAVGRATIKVSSGSMELFSGTVKPGTKLRFIGREIKVKTDNGGAIKVIVGGNPLGLVGEDGAAAEKTYKAYRVSGTEAHLYEIFSSFQGEGLYIGERQIFIRYLDVQHELRVLR